MTDLAVPHAIIDGFLPENIAAQLLAEIMAAAPLFTPSLVGGPKKGSEISEVRSSLRLPGRTGVNLAPFKTAIQAKSVELCAAVGINPFPIYHTECSIVAHGDGHYYRTHVDTRTSRETARQKHFRMLSCVYYLYRQPKGFSGGALNIHALSKQHSETSAIAIEPQHNRLALFPAFVPHEVRDVVCPSGNFADYRFSINCWLHQARASSKG